MDEYMTERAVAALLNIPHSTVVRMRKEGSGPPYHQFVKAIRYRRDDVERWSNERRK